jgi:hypothetical protein
MVDSVYNLCVLCVLGLRVDLEPDARAVLSFSSRAVLSFVSYLVALSLLFFAMVHAMMHAIHEGERGRDGAARRGTQRGNGSGWISCRIPPVDPVCPYFLKRNYVCLIAKPPEKANTSCAKTHPRLSIK